MDGLHSLCFPAGRPTVLVGLALKVLSPGRPLSPRPPGMMSSLRPQVRTGPFSLVAVAGDGRDRGQRAQGKGGGRTPSHWVLRSACGPLQPIQRPPQATAPGQPHNHTAVSGKPPGFASWRCPWLRDLGQKIIFFRIADAFVSSSVKPRQSKCLVVGVSKREHILHAEHECKYV